MNNVRVKFVRGDEVKYISHLDTMKVFERAIRRAQIPIAYSQGFNPHPQMVFGLPLSVGVTSQTEYADFEFSREILPRELMERLNKELPSGLRILDAKIKMDKSNIMSLISASSYDILLASGVKLEKGLIQEKIEHFMNQPVIMAEKESKRGKKEIDIKPMIMSVELRTLEDIAAAAEPGEDSGGIYENNNLWLNEYVKGLYNGEVLRPGYEKDNIFCFSVLLSAGSTANLKPELMVTAFSKTAGLELKLVKVHRTGLFIVSGGRLLDPLDSDVL